MNCSLGKAQFPCYIENENMKNLVWIIVSGCDRQGVCEAQRRGKTTGEANGGYVLGMMCLDANSSRNFYGVRVCACCVHAWAHAPAHADMSQYCERYLAQNSTKPTVREGLWKLHNRKKIPLYSKGTISPFLVYYTDERRWCEILRGKHFHF